MKEGGGEGRGGVGDEPVRHPERGRPRTCAAVGMKCWVEKLTGAVTNV